VLEVNNCTIVFPSESGGAVAAPSDFSLSVREREILGLTGPSGCGKTALGTALLGILERPGRVACGSAVYSFRDGGAADIFALPEQKLRKLRGRELGMVFQDPVAALNPSRKISAQFLDVLRTHDRALTRAQRLNAAREMLERMMFAEPDRVMDSYPFELSGGMCQRAVIALALMPRPRLLIADEPTTALDTKNQAQILRLLRELRDSLDMSIILISHDMDVVSAIADTVVRMES
jgi:ABC-type dipeptide/oligopeptide/nickel transport system ATPase component